MTRPGPRSFSRRRVTPNGFDAGDLTPFPPYFSLAEAIGGYLQGVGIRTRLRTMERAAFLTAWREHKIRGVIMGLGAPAGNAATRIEAYVTKGGNLLIRRGPGDRDALRAAGPRAGPQEARGPACTRSSRSCRTG